VAVEESERGLGVGTAICGVLESRARDAGIDRLFLLTTTAAAFFADRGYRELPREAAPAAIRETTEFDSLCPDSAVSLARSLADER
jgi:amino-acid N-acetyltransferase